MTNAGISNCFSLFYRALIFLIRFFIKKKMNNINKKSVSILMRC